MRSHRPEVPTAASVPSNRVSVGVIGGGIGGLSAALSLLQAGVDVQVYEQAPTLGEVGAGLQVSPNAARVLHRLGLADALPANRVHLDHQLTDLADRGDHVQARFANGAHAEIEALVGADGIHSVVRKVLFGPQEPHFTGCVAYRGLVPADQLADLELEVTAQLWMGPGRHFIHYFVRDQRLLNFVAIVEQDTWTRESWTDRGHLADAQAAFAGWHPQVRAILSAADDCFLTALFDRPPLERWSVGRVTLLGDACHPMLPFMAQGAAQAIEDGATLTTCLTQAGPDVPGALRRYERLRVPRTARLQALSAANKTRLHLSDGPQQQERDAQLASGTTDWSVGTVTWIYEHDPAVLDLTHTPS
jgi:salicylate hydroxylase